MTLQPDELLISIVKKDNIITVITDLGDYLFDITDRGFTDENILEIIHGNISIL